jgi:hypothetical protein
VLNIVPAFALDGEGAFNAVVDIGFGDGTFQRAVKLLMGAIGVLLLGLNMLMAFLQLVLQTY